MSKSRLNGYSGSCYGYCGLLWGIGAFLPSALFFDETKHGKQESTCDYKNAAAQNERAIYIPVISPIVELSHLTF